MPPREWDAASYERVSGPQEQWGRDVLDRLELDGDERVLDAGCGTGRVTAALLERLPHGEVVAVDGSPAMVEETRERRGGGPPGGGGCCPPPRRTGGWGSRSTPSSRPRPSIGSATTTGCSSGCSPR